ncbi:hypothetical protein EII34_09830 [Arachnia propionica]|uniref:Scramblase n=1 Tax=Arachnia propionica TaxID=1750 RepID=A0A3P1T5I9_9ACTN|nr:LURP-one-related family protein [Arachnia propionica]RRD04594.1 hypothetical protein EII34_09830 [Arachnia propionica]
MSVLPHLLTQDVLWVQQTRQFFRSDFLVLGHDGGVVGQLVSSGGALRRALLGNREFTLVDAHNRVLAHITDPFSWGRDTFEVVSANGAPLARLRKEFALFSRHISIALSDGTPLAVRGSLWDREFEISSPSGHSIAHATRLRRGCLQMLTGRDTYQLRFHPQVPPQHRLAILGAVLAVDLIRMKEASAAASSSST